MDDYPSLKRRIDQIRRDADRSAGRLDQIKERLAKEYNCKTMKEAVAKLDEMVRLENDLTREWNEAKAAFEEKWADVLKE